MSTIIDIINLIVQLKAENDQLRAMVEQSRIRIAELEGKNGTSSDTKS